MEESLSKSSSTPDFVLDTSAFLSLESVYLLKDVLHHFSIITTTSVVRELGDITEHEDMLGRTAKRVLTLRSLFSVENSLVIEKLAYVSTTDEELYNLAFSKKVPLITDDTQLTHHAKGKIKRGFSTIFLRIFMDAKLLSSQEALTKLEFMRIIRDWHDNLIYSSTLNEINKEKDNNI